MQEQRDIDERMAALEAHLQNLKERQGETDAALRETVREFREALERHRNHHSSEAQQSSQTRWRWVSIGLAILAVAGPIATFVATKVWG